MFIRGPILLLCVPALAWAQIATAALSGTVTDEEGSPLAGVKITARYLNTGNNWSEVTAEDGKYRLPALPLGSYLLTVSLAGFKTDVRGIPLRNSTDELIVDFRLDAEAGEGSAQSEAPAQPPTVPRRAPIDPPDPPTSSNNRRAPEPQRSPPATQPSPQNQPASGDTRAAAFAVQVASFRPRPKAEELQRVLEGAGYPVQVVEADVAGSGRYHRVRVGPFATEEEAREAASNLRSRFPQRIPDVWIVPHQR